MVPLNLEGAIVNRSTIINVDKLILQIQNCSSLECLANSAEVVKGKLLASQHGEKARLTAEVIPLLQQRLAGMGQDVDGLARMGDSFLSVGEVSKAFGYYTQALRLNPMNVLVLAGIAKAYAVLFQQELPTKEVNDKTVVTLKKEYWLPALENIFFAMELPGPSLNDKLHEIKEIFAEAWFEKGYSYFGKANPIGTLLEGYRCSGNCQSAIICFDRILEIEPRSAKALYAKYLAFMKWDKPGEAEIYRKKAKMIVLFSNEDNYLTLNALS